MKEELKQEQRMDEPIQPFAGVPGAPGETATNFQIHPTIDIYTFPGGKEAFYSRPGVGYNTAGASMIGHYANFTDGDTGFLIYSENASPTSFKICKKSKKDTVWGTRYTLYHSGNLDTSTFASKTSVDAKADKTYVDNALSLKANISTVSAKADKTYVDSALANKADKSALNAKADKTYVDTRIGVSNLPGLLDETNDMILSLISRVSVLELKVNLG